jgi:RHS repeat-associated protein
MQDERYNFDKNGNRIKAEIQDQKQTYKTAEYNRLISDSESESEYKYDLEGNRISKISNDGSTIKYYWDNRNRLAKIDTPNGSIEYIYDHQNRIVLKKQDETTTTFIHDGWQIVLQFDNDKLDHRYLWGTKQDELICDNDNWTLSDHLNTIRDIVKSDGMVTDHLEYNSFGKIISATKNDSSLQFAYTGKLTDKESDLQGNINRWYDAEVGRWMSEDPIGFRGGDGNLYRYGENSVVVLLDISGNAAVGTFDVKIVICNVEPEQVKGAGGEHVPCYDITYNKPNNICITKNSKLSLAQALSSGSWYNIAGLPAHFDNYNDENNKGKKYPDYLGQSGGAGNMRDAPTSEQATIWNITVCAKCTECKDGKTNEAILGCISFSWDSDKKVWSGPGKTPTKKIELKQDGTATSEKGIPASDPDRLWRNAVKHWEKWVRESNK